MSCAKINRGVTKRLKTSSTSDEQFEPFTDWIPAIGVDNVQLVIKRKSVQLEGTAPTWNVQPAIQVALVRPDNPDAWAVFTGTGSPYVGAGESQTDVQSIAGTTGGKMFVRFGVNYYLGGTSPTYGEADVEVVTAYTQCGHLVGAMTQELQVFNTTTDSYVAITGWLPAIEAQKVVAAFVISGLLGNFRCQLAYRTAIASIQVPSSWALLEGAVYRTANGETTTGEITLSITSKMYVQFGIAFSQSTAGSAPGQATVSTSVAVRRS